MKKQFITAIATGTLMLTAFAPLALADTGLQISGNGASSNSNVSSNANNSTNVTQDNSAQVTNRVQNNANTGNNSANENTGGDVTIDTGGASSRTDISTLANKNIADLNGCTSCNRGTTDVLVSGNGFNSNNHVNADANNNTNLNQNNSAYVNNDVTNKETTGNNNANRNTGGDVLVLTGHAASDTSLNTAVNANEASLGGNGGNGSSFTQAVVKGNGADSNNRVNLNDNSSVRLAQDNQANVRNTVKNNEVTGRNNANENTGGNTTIDTGNAQAMTGISTRANFNSADLGNCGCTTGRDTLAKISGNGFNSDNSVNFDNSNNQSVSQRQNADVNNDVSNKHQTGKNSANRNTGNVFGDGVDVTTGHALGSTNLDTATNANIFGPGSALHLPGGRDVNFTFDLNGITGSQYR